MAKLGLDGEGLVFAILVIFDVRFTVREILGALEATTWLRLVVIEGFFGLAKQLGGHFDIFTIFANNDLLAGKGIGYVTKRIDDFFHTVCDQAGHALGQFSY